MAQHGLSIGQGQVHKLAGGKCSGGDSASDFSWLQGVADLRLPSLTGSLLPVQASAKLLISVLAKRASQPGRRCRAPSGEGALPE